MKKFYFKILPSSFVMFLKKKKEIKNIENARIKSVRGEFGGSKFKLKNKG